VVVAGRSKNVGMPIAMLLHTDGAHERPGGKEITFTAVSSPFGENLQRPSCDYLEVLTLLYFVFAVILIVTQSNVGLEAVLTVIKGVYY
jgi:hypothetical protein